MTLFDYLSVCDGLSIIRALRRLLCSSKTISSLLLLQSLIVSSLEVTTVKDPTALEGLRRPGSGLSFFSLLCSGPQYFSEGTGIKIGMGKGRGMKQGSGNISVGGGKIELCGGIAGVGGLASDLILL